MPAALLGWRLESPAALTSACACDHFVCGGGDHSCPQLLAVGKLRAVVLGVQELAVPRQDGLHRGGVDGLASGGIEERLRDVVRIDVGAVLCEGGGGG